MILPLVDSISRHTGCSRGGWEGGRGGVIQWQHVDTQDHVSVVCPTSHSCCSCFGHQPLLLLRLLLLWPPPLLMLLGLLCPPATTPASVATMHDAEATHPIRWPGLVSPQPPHTHAHTSYECVDPPTHTTHTDQLCLLPPPHHHHPLQGSVGLAAHVLVWLPPPPPTHTHQL